MEPQTVPETGRLLPSRGEHLERCRESFKKSLAAVLIVIGVLLAFGAWFVLVVGSYLYLTYR